MKRNNKKLLTIMLAGMLCTATAGTVAAIAPVDASAATTSYALTGTSGVFTTKDAVVEGVGEGDAKRAAFKLSGGDVVKYNNNLAIKWFTAKDTPNYTNMTFTFGAINFTSMSFTFKALPLHATKGEVAVNTVKFINEAGAISVKVIPSGVDEADVTAVATTIATDSTITLALSEDDTLSVGEYFVNLSVGGVAVDMAGAKFTNIGAKYFRTSTAEKDDIYSFSVSTEAADGAEDSILYLDEINGQSFKGLTTDGKVKDSAKPVLVVNDEVSSFLLGARFQLNYNFIDVLDGSLASSELAKYYQYNPADTETNYDATLKIQEKGTYFMETVVYKNANGEYSKTKQDGYTATTVFKEDGKEYVSVKFTPKDDTYTEKEGEFAKAEYMLSWYANSVEVKDGVDYLVFDRNVVGPNYKAYTQADVDVFNAELQKKASEVSGGSNAKLNLPSLAWLIEDANNGYTSLKFTISYKTHSSATPKTNPNVLASDLKIDAKEAGRYEFKIFATDVAGNPMYAKDNDGIDVKVTADNIWDLESIPSFSYTISAKGIETADKEDSDTLDSKNLGETYTMSSVQIVGVTGSEGSNYTLYKLDLSKYTGKGTITTSALSNVKFAVLKTQAEAVVAEELANGVTADKIDYNKVNKLAYARALAAIIDGDAAKLADIFVAIDEYDDRITEENTEAWDASDNKFNWKPTSRSFKTAESGIYLIMADYWDTDMKYVDHVPAYQLVEVESAKDVIKGETEWLKNNLISVILFSVAALMLILIIILLLVKPSDETLEDIDEAVVAKRKQATDRNKKK
jgi:hypothetical protein